MNERRVRYSVAASLDGFIADREGGYDWIVEEPGVDFGRFMAGIDGVLMGRTSYELVLEGPSGWLEEIDVHVFSTTLDPAEHPDVTVVAENAGQVVRELKAREGKDIWLFGGGVLFRSLLEAGVVDRVEVGLVPVLLGAGLPLLPETDVRQKLRLHSVEEFPSGMLLVKYDVER